MLILSLKLQYMIDYMSREVLMNLSLYGEALSKPLVTQTDRTE